MPNLKPYYQVKLTLLRCKLSFLENPPKNEDEQYAYDIIQKAYEINEKKIEMLDFDKNKKLLEDYYSWLDSRQKDNERKNLLIKLYFSSCFYRRKQLEYCR